MSGLRSVIEEVVAGDVESLSGDELSEEAAELSRAMGMLSHRLAEVTDEVRRRGWHELQGFVSVTRWLAVTADMDSGTAQRHVNLGKALRANPVTAERAQSGELSAARVQLLTCAARAHPEVYREHEDMLLGLAAEMELRDLRKAVAHWSNCADATAAERTFEQQQESSYLFVSVTPDQMVKIDGLVDKETGEAVLTAVDAAMHRRRAPRAPAVTCARHRCAGPRLSGRSAGAIWRTTPGPSEGTALRSA